LDNAAASIRKGDIGKASEFLWGSMAEAVKAVAASKGITFYSHRRLKEYASELARELQDKSIFDTFAHANSLHSNFYECELELRDVLRVAEEVRSTVGKLLRLIPERESTSEE